MRELKRQKKQAEADKEEFYKISLQTFEEGAQEMRREEETVAYSIVASRIEEIMYAAVRRA